MHQDIYQHIFDNGLVLLAERMPHVRTAAAQFAIIGGSAYDPPDQLGMAGVLTEMLKRGAGRRTSRELTSALDSLGTSRSETVGRMLLHIGFAVLSKHLKEVLGIYADILRRPHLPPSELEAVKALAYQDLESLEDEPATKVRIELHHAYFPPPLNQDSHGTAGGIQAITPESLRQHYQRLFQPNNVILAVAGDICWPELQQFVGERFADWPRGVTPELTIRPHTPQSRHIPKDTQQTHIAWAFPSVPRAHPQYYAARAAEGIWSGGMSSRLFTEVRERRGLCYSISLEHRTYKDHAAFIGYAGTSADRAQQTLDITVRELRRLREGIQPDEIERIQAGMKSGLILQQESAASRASFLTAEWYYQGRVRTFQELQAIISSITPQVILDYLESYPVDPITVVTLGPAPLRLPDGVPAPAAAATPRDHLPDNPNPVPPDEGSTDRTS